MPAEDEPREKANPPPQGKGPGRGHDVKKAGDWDCPECGDFQFARNTTCRRCGAPRPGSWAAQSSSREPVQLIDPGVPGGKPGDWVCPGCNDLQYARNFACRQCRTPRPANIPGPRFAEAGDWICSTCGDLQFRRNTECRKCGTPHAEGQSANATIAQQQQAAAEAQAIQAALISQAQEGVTDPNAAAFSDEQTQALYLDQIKAMYGMGGIEGVVPQMPDLAQATGPDGLPIQAQIEDLRMQLARAKNNEEDLKRFNKRLDEKIEELENQVALKNTSGGVANPPGGPLDVGVNDPMRAALGAAQAQIQQQAAEIVTLQTRKQEQLMAASMPDGASSITDEDIPFGHLVVEPDKMYFLDSKTSQLFEIGGNSASVQGFLQSFPKAVFAAKAAATSSKPVKQQDRANIHAGRGGDDAERLMRTVRLTNLPHKVESSVIMKSMGKAFGEVACYNVEIDPDTKRTVATVEFKDLFAGIKASRAKQLGPITIAPSPVRCRQEERSRGRSRSRSRRRR